MSAAKACGKVWRIAVVWSAATKEFPETTSPTRTPASLSAISTSWFPPGKDSGSEGNWPGFVATWTNDPEGKGLSLVVSRAQG